MEVAWRECMRYGGNAPDFILVGAAYLDAYRRYSSVSTNRQILDSKGLQKGGVSIDAGTTGVYFKGVELVWDPVFDILDTLDAPASTWAKRCYMINTKFIKLRPIKGSWMVCAQAASHLRPIRAVLGVDCFGRAHYQQAQRSRGADSIA
jgi:hypothetical protein